ncbi:MAG: hypothetical protein COB53_13230, partial [Elusimicrobia bacterium]
RHTFAFPELKKRGIYVVDFVGNGQASRALIRKGQLRFLVRTGAAGQVFTILNQSGKHLKNATLTLAGREFNPDPDGSILVPFTHTPGFEKIILNHEGFSSLDGFDHAAESYDLQAGIHTEREALIKRRKATVAIRPRVMLNGTAISAAVLKNPVLSITSTNREGVASSKEVSDFKLYDDRLSTFEFRVAENLATITFTLKAKVHNHSLDKKENLSVSRTFTINGIDRTEKIEDLHLSRTSRSYSLNLLGKSGESRGGRSVIVQLKHREFRDIVQVSLKSDAQGKVHLGKLKDILWIKVSGPQKTARQWFFQGDLRSMPGAIHARAGTVLSIPYMGSAKQPLRSAFSLLEVRGKNFIRDRFSSLQVKDGFLTLNNLPPGNYNLLLKESGAVIPIRLTEGRRHGDTLLGRDRYLQSPALKPVQIISAKANKGSLTVRLKNATALSRVHVAATRFVPEYSMLDNLTLRLPTPAALKQRRALSGHITGRDIGDEYRYILDRRYAKKYPGNNLERPGLLLNPWAIRKTETDVQSAAAGDAFGRLEARGGDKWKDATAESLRRHRALAKRKRVVDASANLDFLKNPAIVLWNLRPDKNGVLRIPLKRLGAHQQIHIVAADPSGTVYREVSLRKTSRQFEDLRLTSRLDPKKHYTEQKQISVIRAKDSLSLKDITTSKFEVYDTLAGVYSLFSTLSKNSNLTEFGFITSWPSLTPEEKREKYAKYACHELNFFLYKKDPTFFSDVVSPYLKNKKDKTFLDEWLLDASLKKYLKQWKHARLNVVERILLTQTLKGRQASTARHIKDLYDLLPPDIEGYNRLFRTALMGSSLEVGDKFGVERKSRAMRKIMKKASRRRYSREDEEGARTLNAEAPSPEPEALMDGGFSGKSIAAAQDVSTWKRDLQRRAKSRQFYRQLEKTEEWVENNYYKLPIESQKGDLVKVNAFWKDYAARKDNGPFYSKNLAEAAGNFTEMMFALSVLDLPFEAGKHTPAFNDEAMTLAAASPMVVYHREIKPAQKSKEKTPILVSQNYFRLSDRYHHVNNEQIEKYVTEEFLTNVVYGAHVVITNPTSARQKVDILLQIPDGALPVKNTPYTRGLHVRLEPYSTQRKEYYFYFPSPGSYPHYPVQVAKNELIIAAASPQTLKVLTKPSKIDEASWDHISQHGSGSEVLKYLKTHNPHRVNLTRIAWRMKNRAFFNKLLALLEENFLYNDTLWSYSVYHDSPAKTRQYLKHSQYFATRSGAYLRSPLLVLDPVERHSYQHMEYMPLVNARAHRLGKRRSILNNRFAAQYHTFLRLLSYRPIIDQDDLISLTYYLLLQDRIQEGLAFFSKVTPGELKTRLQYDYFSAYLDFFNGKPLRARSIAEKYSDHPIRRWNKAFNSVLARLDEIDKQDDSVAVVDEKDRSQAQTGLAATEPSFEFKVESRTVALNYQNLNEFRVNYYLMDIELLFSRNPFIKQYSDQFSYIRPNLSEVVSLDGKKRSYEFPLPEKIKLSYEYHYFHWSYPLTAFAPIFGWSITKAYFDETLIGTSELATIIGVLTVIGGILQYPSLVRTKVWTYWYPMYLFFGLAPMVAAGFLLFNFHVPISESRREVITEVHEVIGGKIIKDASLYILRDNAFRDHEEFRSFHGRYDLFPTKVTHIQFSFRNGFLGYRIIGARELLRTSKEEPI